MSDGEADCIHIQVNFILYDPYKLLRFIEKEKRKYPSAKRVALHMVGGREDVYELDGIARELGVEVEE